MIKLRNVEEMARFVLRVVNNSMDEARHPERDSVTSFQSSLRTIRVRHSDVFKWLDRIADGKKPGIGVADSYGLEMQEADDGVHFEIRLPIRPSGGGAEGWDQKHLTLIHAPIGSLAFFQTVILLIWNDPTLRERLRCCTNCQRYYFQKSKKRNSKKHYFCSTVYADSTCRQDFCDVERGKKKAPADR